MIKTFGDKDTEKIMNRKRVKGISDDIQIRCRKKLLTLDNIGELSELAAFSGNNLEKLKGTDFWSIRVNKQYRIIFKYENGNFHEVSLSKHYE